MLGLALTYWLMLGCKFWSVGKAHQDVLPRLRNALTTNKTFISKINVRWLRASLRTRPPPFWTYMCSNTPDDARQTFQCYASVQCTTRNLAQGHGQNPNPCTLSPGRWTRKHTITQGLASYLHTLSQGPKGAPSVTFRVKSSIWASLFTS